MVRASLIIASHNEGDSLWKTIQSCVETCVGLDYEIIVADDASWDDSVAQAQQRFPQVRVVRRPTIAAPASMFPADMDAGSHTRQGTSPTKDFGARSAVGETLVFLDGHCKPEPNAIRRLIENVEQFGGRAIFSPAIPALSEQRWRSLPSQVGHGYSLNLETFHCEWLSLSGMRQVRQQSRLFYESPAAIGCAFAVHRELYDVIWGMDPHMQSWGAEDLDFSLKCWLMGFQILHDPEAIIAHRFQQRFDRYDVPLVHYIVNQLRMARKNLTQGTWDDWVRRCRERQSSQSAEHPEGLWAQVWMRFEQDRVSVEQERSYLLGNRPRDEFWYADRFGLAWPKLRSPSAQFGTAGETAKVDTSTVRATQSVFASPSPSPPPPWPWVYLTPPCEDQCCPEQGLQSSVKPIRYLNGELFYAVTDLETPGFGSPWQQRRQYSNQLSQSADMGLGYNWLVETWPYLLQTDTGISFIQSSRNALWFDDVDGVYVARFGAKSTLTHDVGNGLLVLNLPTGQQLKFRDFDSASSSFDPPPQAGQLVSRTDPGGQKTNVVGYTADGRIQAIERQATVDSVLTKEQFQYEFNGAGQTTSLTWRRQTDTDPWQDIRRVTYEYYAGETSGGSAGDLMRVNVQRPTTSGWQSTDQWFYRYYLESESNGFQHGLKYVVEPDGYADLIADGLDPETVSGMVLLQYAKYLFQYDSNRRVTREFVDRGSQSYQFSYQPSSHSDDYNHWKMKTIETRPGGSTFTVYTNYIGQVLINQLQSSGDSWITANQYDDQAHMIQSATPAAVLSYNDTAADLAVSLRSTEGLIKLTSFYSTSGGGAVAGYPESTAIKQGESGTPVVQDRSEYVARTVGANTIYVPSKRTVYRNDNSTGAIPTSYAYTWYTGTFQTQQQTTTLPVVPTNQNGSGVADTRKNYFDPFGNPTWAMDARGYITRSQFDITTAAITRQIDDVDTSLETDAPAGWTTPSGGGLNLITDYQNDARGRNIRMLGPPHVVDINGVATTVRRATWTVYDETELTDTIRIGQGYATGSAPNYTFTLINPVSIRINAKNGKPLEEIQATRASSSGALLSSDMFAQSSYTRWKTFAYTDCCHVSSERVYHTIPATGQGSPGTNFDQTNYGYDSMKRGNRKVSPGGTITRWVHDVRDNVVSTWVGTNDTGASETDPSGGSASGNNMVPVSANQFDNDQDGGDNNRTRETKYVDATTTRVTNFTFDWRNREVDVNGELDRFTRRVYDNLNQVIRVDGYDTSASGNLISRRETRFDNRFRAYQSIRYAVDPSTGAVGNSLTDNTWFDAVGNPVKTLPAGAGESFTKRTFNGVGWNTATYTGFGDDTSYADVLTVTGDVILQQTETAQDDAGNVIQTTQRDRYHNAPASQTGALGSPSLTPNARITYTATYPDPLGRTIADTAYGTAGGAGFTRSATIPASSDTVLVSRQAFSPAGNLQDSTDPAGKVMRVNNDDAGREVETIDNYVASTGTPSSSTACAPSDDVNQTVLTTYTPDGNIKTITAVNADTGDQVTQYLYGTTLATSAIATSNLLSQEIYPDSTGPSDRITHTYNRQAEKTSLTDQNGTVRQFDHDALARPTQDRVTTLGAGVDGSVRRIERAYDVRSNIVRISSFDNAAVGSGSVVNEVAFEFNDFNQSIDTGQAHDGAVVPGTTPSVAMSYADGSDNTIRPASITYPDGRTITRNYGVSGAITNTMNQVFRLVDDDSIVLTEYEYLGLSTFVQQTSPQPDLRYTLISPTLSIDPSTGDIYSGLDRFGRVKDVRWRDVSAGTDLSQIEYGYDRASNRTWRENPSDPNREHDWLYAYDGLHRLSSAHRGQLNTGHTAITDDQFNQCWSLDPTGNWKGFQQDDNADGTADLVQTRTANAVNEITDIINTTGAAWATPTYDPNGNSLVQPRPDLGSGGSMTATYDAWNRMTKLIDSDTIDVLLENQFDGRNFRITAVAGASPKRHYYFTDSWQCVEERVGAATTPERQHVWGMRYIDDLVLRDRATGMSTTLNERFYHLADANWNTTAIVDDSGVVQERYEYTPYGVISYFAADFTPRSTSTYDTRYTYTNREWTPIAGLYYFRNRWYDAVLGRFSYRDPIGYRDSKSLYVGMFVLGNLDPSGMTVSQAACQAAADNFLSSRGNPCVDGGKAIRVECGAAPANLAAGIGGDTGCSNGNRSVVIRIFINRVNDMDGVNRLLEHEYQHAEDICSCDGTCDILRPEPEVEYDPFYCANRTCMEVRACQVADCSTKTGEDLRNCVAGCAIASVLQSNHCKGHVNALIGSALANKRCFSGEDPLPPFPDARPPQ